MKIEERKEEIKKKILEFTKKKNYLIYVIKMKTKTI